MVESRFCPGCGSPHAPEARFCEECGAALVPEAVVPEAALAVSPASNRTLWYVAGAVAAVLVLAGVGFFVFLRDDAKGEAEVFLEPVAFTAEDPFTDTVDLHNQAAAPSSPSSTTPTTEPAFPTTAPARPVSTAATRSVVGARPGLFGGTRDRATCDRDQLIDFLEANTTKARAWAGVLGVPVADIRAYVNTLTPVILQRDTRVTNHGFRDGRATPIQSVLQAGTAVLVDEYGVPRVKCNCGNPLGEPRALATRVRYTGTRWPTFSPANVIRVTVDVKVSIFILVDVDGGEPISRPPGTAGDEDGEIRIDDVCDLYPDDPSCASITTTTPADPDEPTLGTGDVQVTLRWSSTADLDLAVNDPAGGQIDFENRTSPSGGQLDVDSNADCATATTSPVENVFWPTGQAPDGQYRLTVTYYDVCGADTGPQAYELTFKVAGADAEITPAAVRRLDGGYEVTYAVEVERRPSILLAPARPGVIVQNGTVAAGQSQSYVADKGPGFNDTTTQAPEPAPPASTEPGQTTPPAQDCSQYPEGSPMRILCEHVVTDDDYRPGSDPVPVPAPGD
jgi:hypothetical protein